MGKQQDIADGGAIGQQHDQAVNAYALARSRGHAILQRTNIIRIVMHGLKIPGILALRRFAEPLSLVFRIIQLREAIGNFPAGDEQLEAVRDGWVLVVAPSQG